MVSNGVKIITLKATKALKAFMPLWSFGFQKKIRKTFNFFKSKNKTIKTAHEKSKPFSSLDCKCDFFPFWTCSGNFVTPKMWLEQIWKSDLLVAGPK